MLRGFLLRRLGSALVLVLILTATIFALQSVTPGNPAKAYLGANASPAAVAAERHALGLDNPWYEQYARFLADVLRGNLGISYRTHDPVISDLATYLPPTLELVIASFILAFILGTVFAVSGTLRWPGSSLLRGGMLLLAAAPAFLLGVGSIALFFSTLHLLPLGGQGPTDPGPTGFLLIDTLVHGEPAAWWNAFQHLLLPAVALAFVPAVSIGRVLRSSLDQNLDAEYVRTAESKGLTPPYILRKHVTRNSIGPVLSMAGLQLGFMFGSVAVVEQIFSWPGIGNYLAQSIQNADYPAIMGITLVLATVYILANTLVDILQAAADPRLAL